MRITAANLLECAILGLMVVYQCPALGAEEKTETSSQAAQPQEEGAGGASAGAFGMGLAPIRWGGYTTDILRVSQSSEHPTSIDHSTRLDLRASSYLWQPWFVVVNGGVGLARGALDSGDNTGEDKYNSLTGFGDLTLFPQSRFPFTAAFSVSDSSTSSSLTTDDLTSKSFSLRQTYRPETGNSNYSASYQNSTVTSKLNGDDVVETWQGSYSNSIGNQSFGLDASRTSTSQTQDAQGLVLDTLYAHHSYSPGPSLSIQSNALLSDSTLRLLNSSVRSVTTTRYLQAGSYATWLPRENLPLNVTAGVNLFSAQIAIDSVSSQSQSISGNLGATYNPTRNLSLGVSGTVAVVTADQGGTRFSSSAASAEQGATSIITTENANVSYSGDPLIFGKFSYTWNLTGNVSNLTEADGSIQTLSAGASHGLNRAYSISEHSSLNFSVNQSLTSNWDGDIGQYSDLSSSASVAWQVSPSDSASASVNLSATDTRSTGSQQSENQFISLQANGSVQLSAYATATANVGVQWNRQGKTSGVGEGSPESTSLFTTGSASYQNSRAFGVNNLRYSLLANLNMQQTNARLLGDVNATTNPSGYSLEQHLDYRIGRIDMGLTGIVAVQDGRENALLFFHLGRTFGNY